MSSVTPGYVIWRRSMLQFYTPFYLIWFHTGKDYKTMRGGSKAFNNNHLRCYAIGAALLTRLPPLGPHRVIKASEISQLNPFQHIPSFHSYCSYVCSVLTILSGLLQSPPSRELFFFFFHMISLSFYYWIILWCLDIQILFIHMLMDIWLCQLWIKLQ